MGRRSSRAAFVAASFLLLAGCGGNGDLFGSGGAGGAGGAGMGGAGGGTMSHGHSSSTGTHAGGGGMGGQGMGGQGMGGAANGGGGHGGQAQGGGGGAPGCSPDASACQVTGDGNHGLCDGQSSTCIDCNDPGDDAKCAAAYGAGHICIQGSCISGDCRQNGDCSQMSKDVCSGHTCQVCDPVSNALYVVDPMNGDDTTATGSGTAGGHANSACAFKTVTAAIAAVTAAGTASPTTIQILGPSTVAAGETWPLAIPSNTTITASGGLVTVAVPSGQTGFSIGKTEAGIDGKAAGITVDGGALVSNTPQHGVVTASGSDTTDFLTNVTIKGFTNEAIVVNVGGLTIQSGVRVTTSGLPAAQMGPNAQSHFAVRVGDGSAELVINVPAGQTPSLIESNNDGGIQVSGLAKLTIVGVPGASVGTGTVVVQKNPGPGIEISNPSQGQQQASITGVVAYQNGSPSSPAASTTSGIRITTGSSARVRGSVSLGNGYSGIHVTANGAVNGGSIANIDLGAPGGPGLNVVQNSIAQGNPNINGVGICYEGAAGGVGTSLLAEGNIFSGGVMCSTTAATLTTNGAAKSCGGAKDVGTSGATAVIDVTQCSY